MNLCFGVSHPVCPAQLRVGAQLDPRPCTAWPCGFRLQSQEFLTLLTDSIDLFKVNSFFEVLSSLSELRLRDFFLELRFIGAAEQQNQA